MTDTPNAPGTPPVVDPSAVTPPVADPAVTPAAPAAAPAADPAKGGTIAQGAVDEKNKGPADWPTDWREKMAGEDKAYLETLKRYGSPLDFYKKTRELEKLVSSGKHKEPSGPPENATPEQLTAWRKEQGIPEAPEGYVQALKLDAGMTLGETDKPVVLAFAEAAQAEGMKPGQFNGLVKSYYKQQDAIRAANETRDFEFKQTSEQALHNEWGPEFPANINAMNHTLSMMPADLQDNFLGGRLADGSKIGDHPGLVKWLVAQAKEINPAATLLPAGVGNSSKGVNDRIAEIEKLMGDRSSDYWRGAKADAMQQEYRDLIDARTKLSGKAQAA